MENERGGIMVNSQVKNYLEKTIRRIQNNLRFRYKMDTILKKEIKGSQITYGLLKPNQSPLIMVKADLDNFEKYIV